jgi:hypothetical protein
LSPGEENAKKTRPGRVPVGNSWTTQATTFVTFSSPIRWRELMHCDGGVFWRPGGARDRPHDPALLLLFVLFTDRLGLGVGCTRPRWGQARNTCTVPSSLAELCDGPTLGDVLVAGDDEVGRWKARFSSGCLPSYLSCCSGTSSPDWIEVRQVGKQRKLRTVWHFLHILGSD